MNTWKKRRKDGGKRLPKIWMAMRSSLGADKVWERPWTRAIS